MSAPYLCLAPAVPTYTGEDGQQYPHDGYIVMAVTEHGVYLDCAGDRPLPEGGTLVSGGTARYVKAMDTEHGARICRADVIRRRDGKSARRAANDAASGSLASYCPATGRTSRQPAPEARPEEVLAAARAQVEAGEAVQRSVPMGEVQSGDVVITDMGRHYYAGEHD